MYARSPLLQSSLLLRSASRAWTSPLLHSTRRHLLTIPPLTAQTKDMADKLLRENGRNEQEDLQRRFALSRAITLLESTNDKRAADAEGLLAHLLQARAKAQQRTLRIGIAGPPGAGK